MTHNSRAAKLKFKPLVLKQLVLDCGISQSEMARVVATGAGKPCSRPLMNRVINAGYIPTTFPHFKRDIEQMLRQHDEAMAWLKDHQYKLQDIWEQQGEKLRHARPSDMGERIWAGRNFKALVPADPDSGELTMEVEMLTAKAKKQFRIFQTPFGNNIDVTKDSFLSDDHRYIYMAMKEAAEHAGMIAVMGEVGSGKTVMRKLFMHELRQNPNIRMIYPRIVDKEKINAGSICDAIIMDLLGNDAKCKARLEHKSRQVEDLIVKHAKSGIRMALVLEESQDLAKCPRVLKLFKRFNEIEADGDKVLGIILIGQPELGDLLNEEIHYDMREVIRRIQVAEIQGLNGAIKDYLLHRFKRVTLDLKTCVTDGAIDALTKRLTTKEGVSIAYPLTVNNYLIKAMNFAAAHGYEKVTEEVVMSI